MTNPHPLSVPYILNDTIILRDLQHALIHLYTQIIIQLMLKKEFGTPYLLDLPQLLQLCDNLHNFLVTQQTKFFKNSSEGKYLK